MLEGQGATTDVGSLASADGHSRPVASSLLLVAAPCALRVGERVRLSQDLITLGREVGALACSFDDARMSRLHARCVWDTRMGAHRIGDAQSRNGTCVNGRRVESALLSHNDVVRLGDCVFVYEERDEERQLDAEAVRLARSELPILLRGETGSGKERLARQIHEASGRRGHFIAVNCGSLPRELVASELFGHTRGAFSGAQGARRGLFTTAEGGTLLLDEIGDCPRDVQLALLRALQERAVRPVGAEHEVPVDVRVMAATHVDLERAMADGTFREDLYARLATVTVQIAPLRERRSEILPTARAIARQCGRELAISADAAEAMTLFDWRLNVRQLQALVQAFCVRRDEQASLDLHYLTKHHPELAALVSPRRSERPAGADEEPPRAGPEQRRQLRSLLDVHQGNVSKVAEVLGKPRAQVYRWMRAMGLSAATFRK